MVICHSLYAYLPLSCSGYTALYFFGHMTLSLSLDPQLCPSLDPRHYPLLWTESCPSLWTYSTVPFFGLMGRSFSLDIQHCPTLWSHRSVLLFGHTTLSHSLDTLHCLISSSHSQQKAQHTIRNGQFISPFRLGGVSTPFHLRICSTQNEHSLSSAQAAH